MSPRLFGIGLVVATSGCKAIATLAAGDSGAPTETVLETKLPSPSNAKADFKVGDDVAILEDDGAFKLGGTVEAIATGGYTVRMPRARGIDVRSVSSSHVFPAPWVPLGSLKVGDSFQKRRFGNFVSPKCIVTEPRHATQGWLMAKCESDDRARSIEQKDVFAAFAPATLAGLTDGEIVYVDKTQWAMVVGKSGPQVVVREEGFAGRDKAIDVARVERVH